MMFLMENWYLVVALMAVAGMVGVCIGRFLKMPTAAQREKVKEWLLWAVTQAEAELVEYLKLLINDPGVSL